MHVCARVCALCVCVCVDVHKFLGISRLCWLSCEPQVPFSADRTGTLWAGVAQAAKEEEFPRWGWEMID